MATAANDGWPFTKYTGHSFAALNLIASAAHP
jgi:hypothetical protein